MYTSYDVGRDRILCLETEGERKIVQVPGFGYESRFYSDPSYVDTLSDKGFGLLIPQISARHEIGSRPITIDDHAELLSCFLEEASRRNDLSEFYLSGHSFGGAIALEYAAENPVGLKGVVAMNTCIPVDHGIVKHMMNYCRLSLDDLLGKEKNMRDKLLPYMDNLLRLGSDAFSIVDEIVNYKIDRNALEMPGLAVHSKNDRLYNLTYDVCKQFDDIGVGIMEVDANHNWCISHPKQAAELVSAFFAHI